MSNNSQSRYSLTYRVLHSAIAVCIILLFSMQYIRLLFNADIQNAVRELHKSIGLVTIALLAVRAGLRLFSERPGEFIDPSPFRALAARIVRRCLWGLMVLVPCLGVAFLLARGRGVDFILLFSVPPLTSGSSYWGDIALTTHRYAAFALIGAVSLHVAGALFHHLILKDSLSKRMSFSRSNSK